MSWKTAYIWSLNLIDNTLHYFAYSMNNNSVSDNSPMSSLLNAPFGAKYKDPSYFQPNWAIPWCVHTEASSIFSTLCWISQWQRYYAIEEGYFLSTSAKPCRHGWGWINCIEMCVFAREWTCRVQMGHQRMVSESRTQWFERISGGTLFMNADISLVSLAQC